MQKPRKFINHCTIDGTLHKLIMNSRGNIQPRNKGETQLLMMSSCAATSKDVSSILPQVNQLSPWSVTRQAPWRLASGMVPSTNTSGLHRKVARDGRRAWGSPYTSCTWKISLSEPPLIPVAYTTDLWKEHSK